ncbi:uncharacterized protein LOC6563111 [Drosophila grimshawi]|uniref:Proteasome assembly chaperone 1 n=1 Tax=Drosophila grimshawi TaxID=7222 RepID=B4JG89_DROGR|nr:uncharacterized protein LOC6563111 [Drosophila grimshawi]EDV93656.1 GH19435 [Drosophila grimshawi]
MSCPGFGEVNIPSSRAFWDDCEEDEFESIEPATKSQLNFKEGADETPLVSDVFVLIEGPHINEFCTGALLKESKRICDIPAKSSSLHWNAAKGQLLAVLEEDLTSSGEITDLLIPYAQVAKRVLTITLKPKVDYKSEEIDRYREDVAIIHSVGGNGGDKSVRELEAPNFIAGAAAGIACWRNEMELPVSSYVVYTDKLPLDVIAAQPVLKLLQKLGVPCSERYVPPSKESSYLYM